MCLKIRYDGKCEKFCKIFWKLNKAHVYYLSPFVLFNFFINYKINKLLLKYLISNNKISHNK